MYSSTRLTCIKYNTEFSKALLQKFFHQSYNFYVNGIRTATVGYWPGTLHVWGREELRTGCWCANPRERDHYDDLCVDRRIKLKQIFKIYNGGVDWMELTLDRDGWRVLVNAVMNVLVHKIREISKLATSLHVAS
jgi:hypothetical protein